MMRQTPQVCAAALGAVWGQISGRWTQPHNHPQPCAVKIVAQPAASGVFEKSRFVRTVEQVLEKTVRLNVNRNLSTKKLHKPEGASFLACACSAAVGSS